MKFKIETYLDKIEINKLNIEQTMKEIEDNLKERAGSFKVINVQKGVPKECVPVIFYKYGDCVKWGYRFAVEIEFMFSTIKFEYIKPIYEIYIYLKQFNTDKTPLTIEVEEFKGTETVEKAKYETFISKNQKTIFKKHGSCKDEFDFIDFMSYIKENYTKGREEKEFNKFLKYMEIKEENKDVLENIKNYEKKIIPVQFRRKLDIPYKGKNIIGVYSFDSLNEFIEEFEKAKKTKLWIIDEQNVDYKLINTDFSTTVLTKYILLDENKNIFYVLEENIGLVDEISCTLYFSTEEIPNEEMSEFILFSDECSKK